MPYDDVAAARVEGQVNQALEAVRRVLDTTKKPTLAASVDHTYSDKFTLMNYLTRLLRESNWHYLHVLGLTSTEQTKLNNWAAEGKAVTLRFGFVIKCDFLRKATREVEDAVKHVTEYSSSSGTSKSTRTDKTITKVTEWFWKYSVSYELSAYGGTDTDDKITITDPQQQSVLEMKTITEAAPHPSTSIVGPFDVSISWLLSDGFEINRDSEHCRTPSNNVEVRKALQYSNGIRCWSEQVELNFRRQLQMCHLDVNQKPLDLTSLQSDGVFSPILPILDDTGTPGQETLWVPNALLIEEQKRSIVEKANSLAKVFPSQGYVTQNCALITVVMQSLQKSCQQYSDSSDYIERMLRDQLTKAIGKELHSDDFYEYMAYHNRKIFKGEVIKNLSHTVRTDEKTPEGIVGISREENGGPILAISQATVNMEPLTFELNASSSVTIRGTRHIHSWVNYNFGSDTTTRVFLNARARQFSSFVMVVGKLGPNNSFLPSSSIVIRNKDDLTIPLYLETIPPPKEFKKSIESLSPEQKRFASAYRSMQLAGTLCGICIIEIKPQLEKVLNLPRDALTKEIKLTEHLLELLLDYQIPSDLLSYDNEVDIPSDGHCQGTDIDTVHKINSVKNHVKDIKEMINEAKQAEIDEKEKQRRIIDSPTHSLCADEWMYSLPSKSCPAPEMPCIETASRCSLRCVDEEEECCEPLIEEVPQQQAPPPQQQQQQQQQQQKQQDQPEPERHTGSGQSILDLPMVLEKRMELLDPTASLRPTMIKAAGTDWVKKFQPGLLSPSQSTLLDESDLLTEHNKCFDLLDALTKSGAIPVDDANLHILLSSTHCFTNSLMETVYHDNLNPIERVECSTLIMASTVFGTNPSLLLQDEHSLRIKDHSPSLFTSDLKLK